MQAFFLSAVSHMSVNTDEADAPCFLRPNFCKPEKMAEQILPIFYAKFAMVWALVQYLDFPLGHKQGQPAYSWGAFCPKWWNGTTAQYSRTKKYMLGLIQLHSYAK